MERRHLDEFSEEDLRLACSHWELDTKPLPERVSQSENLVFRARRGDNIIALRFTHQSHRGYEHLLGEAEWVEFLSERGVSCPRMIHSRSGALVESVGAANAPVWHVTAFAWAPGKPLWQTKGELSGELIEAWGEALGKMQALSIESNRRGQRFDRPDWRGVFYGNLLQGLEESHADLVAAARVAIDEVAILPQTEEDFGLAHSDLHGGNVLVDEAGQLTCIDFDDAAYHYFLQDVTIPVYYALLRCSGDALRRESKRFFGSFLRGYLRRVERRPEWFRRMPLFLRLRDLDLAMILRLWDDDVNGKLRRLIDERLREGNPMREFPWVEWAAEVIAENPRRLARPAATGEAELAN